MTIISKFFAASAATLCISVSAFAGHFTVESGKTKPLRLETEATSIVVGNPNVADVAVHNGKLIFISGKAFGTTNLMIFDKAGNTIYSSDIVVTTNTANLVTVNRAGNNFTYDCAPACRSGLSVGDDQNHYQNTRSQMQQQSQLAE